MRIIHLTTDTLGSVTYRSAFVDICEVEKCTDVVGRAIRFASEPIRVVRVWMIGHSMRATAHGTICSSEPEALRIA